MSGTTSATSATTVQAKTTDEQIKKEKEKVNGAAFVPYGFGILIGLATYGVVVWAGVLLLENQATYNAGVATIVLITLTLVVFVMVFAIVYNDLSRLKKCEASMTKVAT